MAGVVAAGLLGWNLYGRFASDRIAGLIEKRRTGSRMVGRGELVDGNRHMAVALALTDSTLFYENSDLQASLDLEWVREIEYDTELVTGQHVEVGRVLRLRSSSRTVEFVLPQETLTRWHTMLPPRQARTA
ncbi:MAG TPA: hypothetical protein VEO54_29490 [Thermoanaerobaculia bacterium]|nr:hypothetical protein [Thermoanaerobaculia bacterium]